MQFSNLLFAIFVGSALAMPDLQQANEPNKISAKVNIPFFRQIFLIEPAYTDENIGMQSMA